MFRRSYVAKDQFRYCIEEKWEDDDAFEPGTYAKRYYEELCSIFQNFYQAYPDMFSEDVLKKAWMNELALMDKRSESETVNRIYHYSDRVKSPGMGVVNQYALRIYLFDQKHADPSLFCVEVAKFIQFRNINIMDKLEGRFLYHKDKGIERVLNIDYLIGKENGQYIKVKIPKEQLLELIPPKNTRKRS